MKTTYVVKYKDLAGIKLSILPPKNIIDYYFDRTKLIRWNKTENKFSLITGLIDISLTKEMYLVPSDAKSQANSINTEFLVNRKQISEYYFQEINRYGILYHVVGEDVKHKLKLIDEYHIVFDEKIEKTPPFKFIVHFYGNLYDYLKSKQNEQKLS